MDDDLDILTRTVYGESRGEPDLGRLAVAYVFCNRAAIAVRFVASHGRPHPLYGNGTVASACRMPYQASCWNASDPNLIKLLTPPLEGDLMAPCLWVAKAALGETLPDPSCGATHYVTAMSPFEGTPWPPIWTHTMTLCATIGGHLFYRASG